MKKKALSLIFFAALILASNPILAFFKSAGVSNQFADILANAALVVISLPVLIRSISVESIWKMIFLGAFTFLTSSSIEISKKLLLLAFPEADLFQPEPAGVPLTIPMILTGYGPAIALLIKALVSSPLNEELIRYPLQKGLTLFASENISLVIVSLIFSLLHHGYVSLVIPFFIIMGVMVKNEFTWMERSVVHMTSNFAILLNFLFFRIGAYTGPHATPILCGELLLILLVMVCTLKPALRILQRKKEYV